MPFVLCLCNLGVDLNLLPAVISRASLPFHASHLVLNNSSGSAMGSRPHGEGSPQPQLHSAAGVHP